MRSCRHSSSAGAPIRSDAVGFEEAAFTTLGAVALHGMRSGEVKLGDVVAVIGLGLVGQLAVQLLKAAGCHVLGMDIDPERAQLARTLALMPSVVTPPILILSVTFIPADNGVDAVLITAETPAVLPQI